MESAFYIFAGWILAVIVSVTACEKMARSRKRDVEGWMLLCAFGGPVALLVLRLLGEAAPQSREERERSARVSTGLSLALVLVLVLVMAVPLARACFRF